MEIETIIAFGIGFLSGGITVGYFAYLNHTIDATDWGDPEEEDPHEDIDYADIPAFLRRQAD